MTQKLANKTAVVTGGSKGIGRGISDCLIAAGAKVVVADLHAPKDLDNWQSTVEGAVEWVKTDVTSSESIKALAEQ
ncbi:MAG: SDR family NAD(P)-dependent oxidoreductase, partial [Pseudomonadota bacterium]